jgi:hypothetical protein
VCAGSTLKAVLAARPLARERSTHIQENLPLEVQRTMLELLQRHQQKVHKEEAVSNSDLNGSMHGSDGSIYNTYTSPNERIMERMIGMEATPFKCAVVLN